MSKKEDLTGNKYGKLTVKEMLYNHNGKGRTKCLCECECGNTCIKLAYELKKRSNPSCGCARKEIAKEVFGKDINGKKFGRLVVLETLWEEQPPKVKCQCDCGNITYATTSNLNSGHIKSCGCLHSYKEMLITKFLNKNHISFKQEYCFSDLKNPDTDCYLRYDFALFNQEQLIGLIEYNGA